MDLSIVIVNYKTPQLLSNCIDSILKETTKISFEIIVVDNNSEDNSREVVLQKFPQIIWIPLTVNIGFAGGNNEGIKLSKGDYILLLNSDTIILDGAIDKCVSYLKKQQDTSIAVLGCRLLKEDHSVQPSSLPKISWPAMKNTILQNVVIEKLISVFFKNYYYDKWNSGNMPASTHFADAITGAFILFRSGILKCAGLMDADFFMYFEEIEWAHRVAKSGYKIVYYNEAGIIHLQGSSSLNMPVSRQSILSQGLFILKVYGKPGYLLYLSMQYFNIYSGFILYPFLSAKSKANLTEWAKIFLPLRSGHFRTLFKYRKGNSSYKEPLKFDNS